MRFFSSLFFLSALSVLPAFARMNQLVSRTSNDHPIIAHRQHQPVKASLLDVCAPVDISLLVKVSALGILEASASVEAHICICVSVVPVFVKSDIRIRDYVDRVGESVAITKIKELVRSLNLLGSK